MKLFHSSNVAVSSPDVVHSRDYLENPTFNIAFDPRK